MQPDSLSRFASERLKDDHDGITPEDDGTATLRAGVDHDPAAAAGGRLGR